MKICIFLDFLDLFVSSEGHVCVMISEQKLPQGLILIMHGLNDPDLLTENGPKPNEFVDFS